MILLLNDLYTQCYYIINIHNKEHIHEIFNDSAFVNNCYYIHILIKQLSQFDVKKHHFYII